MQFRIRDCDSEDYDTILSADARYREHLGAFDKRRESDLWDFFAWDFFHDGWIDRIWFEDGIRTLKLHIWAPNTKRFTGEGDDFEYINLGFTCTFSHVADIRFVREDLEDWPSSTHSVGFHYAEINTSPLLERLNTDDDDDWGFHSLLIQLEAEGEWIEVVFSGLNVEADEPAAFELMKASPQFEITAYQGRGLTRAST